MGSMLPNSLHKIACNPNVENTPRAIGHEVNKISILWLRCIHHSISDRKFR
jgi:hypothetical protein